jgi:TolB-like protein
LAGVAILGGVAALTARYLMRQGPAADQRPRVVVGIFANRTGSPRNEPLGFMAADWIVEGLQRTGEVDVVPTLTAMTATRFLHRTADTLDPVAGLARETTARLVVSGSVYEEGDSLIFQAQLIDAAARKVVGAVEPVRAPLSQPAAALQPIRARLMGLLALSLDTRVISAERPPLYEAYRAFSEGMDAYLQNEYRPAIAAFETAYAADSTFALPLLYGAFCYVDLFEYAKADSLLHVLQRQRSRLTDYDQHWLDYQLAELEGKDQQSLAAIRAAAEMAPSSKATYNLAVRAIEARQPELGESALRTLSPDVGSMRGWLGYWDVLDVALHAQAKYREELTASKAARRRFPERIGPHLTQMRALGALGRLNDMEKEWSTATGSLTTTPADAGALALEGGMELAAHSDTMAARRWFTRAYDAYAAADTGQAETSARWGRARAAARLGMLQEALRLGSSLAEQSAEPEYLGFVGVVAAELGQRARAASLAQQLGTDTSSFTFGRPQLQAARIAAALGDVARAEQWLGAAYRKGYPHDTQMHRDPVLRPLQGLPIMRRMLGQHD